MGGFAHGLGEVAEAAAGALKPEVKGIGAEIESGFMRTFFSDRSVLNQHPAGKLLDELHTKTYVPMQHKIESQAIDAVSKGQPMASPVTGQPLISPKDISAHAHQTAYKETYGENGWRIQAAVKAIERDLGKNKADTVVDTLHIKLQQAQPNTPAIGKNGRLVGTVTQLQKDLAHDYPEQGIEPFRANNSKYKETGKLEKVAQGFQQLLAFKAAVIHAAVTPINLITADGFHSFAKAAITMWGPGREAAENAILSHNAISNLKMDQYREDWAFQNGLIHKFAPGSVGAWVHQNMHIPFLSDVRRESLLWAAQMGKQAAEVAAAKLKAGDSRWAIPAFKELGIDAGKVASNGFQLDADDLDKAYHHGANNRVFLNPYDSTPSIWRQSPFLRQMKAFSGYITKEQVFLRDTFQRQVKQGDYVGIARNLALWSLAVPLVGSTVYEFERVLSGEDTDDPMGHLAKRAQATPAGQIAYALKNKRDPANAAKTMMNTVEMLAKMAAFGGIAGYVRGANRANLIESMAPPMARMSAQGLEDAAKALHTDAKHPDAADPLWRDMLNDIMSPLGLGQNISHRILPTRQEKSKQKIHKLRKLKPSDESWNPLTYQDINEF